MNTSEHKKWHRNGTVNGTVKTAGQSGAKRRLPKTHADFWFSRLEKRFYVDNGRRVEMPTWYVRLAKSGQRAYFNLGTANRAAAARNALEIYVFLQANGWAATLARYKARETVTAKTDITVGRYLEAVRAAGVLRPRTFLNYANCFRTIVSEAFGVRAGSKKFDYKTGGNRAWRDQIDRIRLARVTPDKVTDWQKNRITLAGNSPVAIARARRTCNSYVRCARSLFSRRVQRTLRGIELPTPLPFDGVELFESGNVKYVSRMNVQALVATARRELKEADPEAYKAFLLGLFAGLRKGEADLLEWRMVDFANSVIRLEETEWLHLKTRDSAEPVWLDSEVAAELRSFMASSKSQFVITSDRPPRGESLRPYYRCEPVFDRLNRWLRSKGVGANKPLHELRKELGAIVASKHGIYAASRFLRHSDISTTARHYADIKDRINVGLGKLLNSQLERVEQG
ncbi:MAG: tyrosine-type recombinase/integrase [Verrucomicrobiia bacterium]